MYNRGIGTIPRCNAYGYCCAYSATIVRWLCTWGVAPGSKLLRFQRALDTWVLSVAIMASSLATSPGRGAVFSVRVGYIGVVRGYHGIVPRHLPWPWGRTFGTRWPHGFARGIMDIATRHLPWQWVTYFDARSSHRATYENC